VDIPEGYGEVTSLCPIHGEHRPSLRVNLEKGLFFCNACQAKGTAIDLVMAMESCPREEARDRAEKLAVTAGVAIARPVGRYQRPGEVRAQTSGRRYVPPGRRSS